MPNEPSVAYMFSNLTIKLKSITGINYLRKPFESTKSLDCSHIFENSNLSDAHVESKELQSLLTRAENISYAFAGFAVPSGFDFNYVELGNPKNMEGLFENSPVETIDITRWKTENVENMNYMFKNAHSLKHIYINQG